MRLLSHKALGPDPDDGILATYECQACDTIIDFSEDGWSMPSTHIPCTQCGWNEEGYES